MKNLKDLTRNPEGATKSISDLPRDIYKVLEEGKLTEASVEKFTDRLKAILIQRFTQERGDPKLRMSNLGAPECKLYYDIHSSEREELTGQTLFKFLYGDIVEQLALWLAQEAGHTVEAEQQEVEINGVKGHLDCILDGVLVDVKSASGRGFDKFKWHGLENDDPFGYLEQLGGYLQASQGDERLKVKGQAAFLAVNKENGAIAVDTYSYPNAREAWEQKVEAKRTMLAQPKRPPRAFNPEPDGKSGNMKLGVNCRYCHHKHTCWPGLRTFAYSNGPVFMTRVVKEPNVPEIKEKVVDSE